MEISDVCWRITENNCQPALSKVQSHPYMKTKAVQRERNNVENVFENYSPIGLRDTKIGNVSG
ncbi:hypothetical protein FK85_24620 [Halorubrum saccharovorum]|uniref:Uncharacterized protein n=1 Tax=Halorubrum saccharovorum TaxID=2248 RepID=A0A0F8D6K9_9EURY|nr:hypothetical protein FK85_24620 [Halorubrum saccharovorum]